jgi:hypothetical protein
VGRDFSNESSGQLVVEGAFPQQEDQAQSSAVDQLLVSEFLHVLNRYQLAREPRRP